MVQETDICRFQENLGNWYQAHQRNLPWRKTRDPYHIWISEVMLQQTQVKTVIPYFLNFIDRFPLIHDLAQSDLETVLKMWEGLGYYARARNFFKAAQIISLQRDGVIPKDVSEFKQLPGVGNYISAAVMSIAFDLPFAVVDGNVKRILARLDCINHPINKSNHHDYFQESANGLLNKNDPGMFNQAMMELGALVCTPRNPQCITCPVSEFCRAFVSDTVKTYPVRVKTQKIPTVHIAVGIIRKKEKLLITRRKFDGLLGGLWEFPGGKLKPHETAESACIRELTEETGITAKIDHHLATIHHAYTHFKIKMEVFICRYISGRVFLKGPIDFRWIRLKEIDTFAFPKANLKFIPLIKQTKSGQKIH